MNADSRKPESDSTLALVEALHALTEQMKRQNSLLTQIVAHNTDLLTAAVQEEEEPTRMTLDGQRY